MLHSIFIYAKQQHCTHCFHKDCILQWLENHNDCPFCRVDMITDSEMNKAATHLVGKTRMYRAVATMQPSSSLTASAVRTTTTSTPNGSSPVVLAHSYRPYSLQQRPSRRNIHSTQQQIRTVPAPTTIGGRGTVRRNVLAQSALDGTSR
jgi:galactose-1-phosphate uridylyltransferase